MDRSPLHLLHRAMQQANDVFFSNVADITPRQLAVLITLDESEGANQQALSEHTGIDRSTLGEIIRRLVLRGLVDRRRNGEDARANVVRLTSEGQHLLRQVELPTRNVEQRVLSALPENRRERFLDLLSALPSKLGSDPAA
jgi:DNA-binding MarR family transcriptional regulator